MPSPPLRLCVIHVEQRQLQIQIQISHYLSYFVSFLSWAEAIYSNTIFYLTILMDRIQSIIKSTQADREDLELGLNGDSRLVKMGAAGPAGAEWSHFETEARSHESARALGSHRQQLAAEGGGGSSPALQFYSSPAIQLSYFQISALQLLCQLHHPTTTQLSSEGGVGDTFPTPGQALICRETPLQLLISFYQPCLPWCLVERTKRFICSNSFHRSK